MIKQKKEEKGLEERLAHVGKLTAGIGHNIMTPLSLIMMNADLLSMKVKGDREFSAHLEEIIHQANVISKIAETMMWKVKAEEQTKRIAIQIGDLAQENLNFWMGDMFFKHKLSKNFNINPHTPPIVGVPFHFTAFIDEWITSVIERAQPINGGKLVVEVDVDDEKEVFIQFEDDLPLPAEEEVKILKSGCSDPASVDVFPALTRLLGNHPGEITFDISGEKGVRLRLTWALG